jgi:hypothetical protein
LNEGAPAGAIGLKDDAGAGAIGLNDGAIGADWNC